MKKNIITLAFIASISLAFYATTAMGRTKAECEAECADERHMIGYRAGCVGKPAPDICVALSLQACQSSCTDDPVPQPPE